MTTSNTAVAWSSAELLGEMSWVRSLALSLVRDAAQADDLVQETLLAALERRPRSDRPLRPWLARVLRNRAALWRRGEARRSAREREREATEALPSSDELLEQAELQGAIVESLAKLREPYRTVLLLHFHEGLAPAEIARRQDVPAATVRSQLSRGIAELRAALDARYGEDRRRWALAAVPLATRSPGAAGTFAALGVAHKVAVALILVAGSVAFGRWALRAPDARAHEPGAGGFAAAETTGLVAAEAQPERRPVADPALVLAEDEPITGVVLELESREPVPHYALEIQDAEGEIELVWTDAEGRFTTERSYAPGNYTVTSIDHPDLSMTVAGQPAMLSVATAGGIRWNPAETPSLQRSVSVGPSYALSFGAFPGWQALGLVASLRAQEPTGVAYHAPVRGEDAPWVRFQPLFTALPRAGTWSLELVSSDGLVVGRAEVPADERGVTEPVPIALEPCARLELALVSVDSLREPIVVLEALSDGVRRRLTATGHALGSDGRQRYDFARSALPGGDQRVLVQLEGEEHERATVSLLPGQLLEREVELAAGPPAAHVRGELRSESGTFRERMNVQLVAPGTQRMQLPTWTQVDGRWVAPFEFANLPPGEYEVFLVSERSNQRWTPFPWRVVAPVEDLVLTCQDTEPVRDMEVRLARAEPGPGMPLAFVELTGCAEPSMMMSAGGAGGAMRLMYAAVPEDVELTCYAWAEGCAPFVGDQNDLVREGEKLVIDVLLEPGWGARIRTSLEGVEVLVDGEPAGTTDAKGELVLVLPEAPGRVDLGLAGHRFDGGDWDPDAGRLTGRFGTHAVRFVPDP